MTTIPPAPAPAFIVGRLDGLILGHGQHKPGKGFCAMEAVAWAAGLPHSDFPTCTLRSVATLFQRLNDWRGWADDLERTTWLLPRLRLLADLPVPDEAGERRVAFALADYVVRGITAEAMERAGRDVVAAELRSLAPVTDVETAMTASRVVHAAAAAGFRAADTARAAADAALAASRFARFALADAALAALAAIAFAAATAAAAAFRADAEAARAAFTAAHVTTYLRHADGLIAAAVAAAKGGAK